MTTHLVRALLASSFLSSTLCANVLVPFWGGRIVPDSKPGPAISLDLHQFTEFDTDTARYGSLRGTDSSWYHRTIGFNTLSAAQAFGWKSTESCTTYVVANIGLGVADDGLTEFLQNDYTHERNGVPPVPRGDVEDGPLAMAGIRMTLRPRSGTGYFLAGVELSNIVHDIHMGAGIAELELFRILGTRILLDAGLQMGILRNARKYGFGKSRYFPKTTTQYLDHQMALGFSTKVFGIPVAGEAGYLASSGMFVSYDGTALRELFEYTRFRIWKIVLEKSNDGFNAKDFGPTYGVRLIYEH